MVQFLGTHCRFKFEYQGDGVMVEVTAAKMIQVVCHVKLAAY